MPDRRDLELVLGSHFPLITVCSHEETRAVAMIKAIAAKLDQRLNQWTITDGLTTLLGGQPASVSANKWSLAGDGASITKTTADAETALRTIRNDKEPGIFLLLDFHPFLDEAVNIRLLKEIAQEFSLRQQRIVFISHEIELPGELARFGAEFKLSLPDQEKLRQIIIEEAQLWMLKHKGRKLEYDREAVEVLARNLTGLTTTDATRLIRNAIYDDGAITASDIPQVARAKHELVGNEGVLSFEYDTANMADIGGFTKLKQWLSKRKNAFLSQGAELPDPPKGILLLGVQGSGKSLAAKAVAGMLQVPLLRLDFGSLYNKFFGETERNMRLALSTAEVVSPCVLWADEIEKGISTGDYDSGTSRRVLATLLTWMAENKKPVFIVATANDISALPPELIRKGRVDEIFFVDLPNSAIRREIFAIHLKKRGADPVQFELDQLAYACEGFSGAEIEQAIVSALYSNHGSNSVLDTAQILREIRATQPLSVVMAEKIAQLRAWAAGRTVPVD